MRKLAIISHTEHYKTADGSIVGLGSTVTEINHLLEVFDEIIHVAMLHDGVAPPSSLPYTSNKIKFIALPAVGGKNLLDKLAIVYQAANILKIIKKAIRQTDYFQFRAPTGIGVFVIPYFVFFSSKKGWFKYAGNWKQEDAPLAYRFQRWLLKKQKRKVTINGRWQDQEAHCITFENPCLTNQEIKEGQEIIRTKVLDSKAIRFCFVGRLEAAKGLDLLMEAFKQLTIDEKANIASIAIVGDGKGKQAYMQRALNSDLPFRFPGFLSRKDVHAIYKESHAIVLPSASEGFPKVIAEAMNYGCLPIVSNVSSISNYVQSDRNGFLLESISVASLLICIRAVLQMSSSSFSKRSHSANTDLVKFSYSYYNIRISEELLN